MFHLNILIIVVTDCSSVNEIFHEGKLVYQEITLKETEEFAANNLDGLWMNTSVLNPQDYPVDLSQNYMTTR